MRSTLAACSRPPAMCGATSSRARETEGMPDPAHLRDHAEMQQGGRWTDADNMICTRAKIR
ncbi:MAG: hypothetical protein M3R43_12535 [Acidobacteriota bacterium]|nr:hypothetical protein [Acidobacteriota bacterium]